MAGMTYCYQCMAVKAKAGLCPICQVDDRTIPDTANTLPHGTILQNKYLIGRLLGAGGFGNTYLALEFNLGTKLAIKEYLPSGLASRRMGETAVHVFAGEAEFNFATGLEKFVDEAKTLATFNDHPGVVSVRDFFYEHQTAFIVMEYVEGITLKQYVKQKGGRLPVEQVLEIFRPVMDALRAVHEVGILHRDISPDNIYITKTRQVKLLDFGAARQAIGEASKS
jgi:serine/threonine protein kinase